MKKVTIELNQHSQITWIVGEKEVVDIFSFYEDRALKVQFKSGDIINYVGYAYTLTIIHPKNKA